MKSAASSAEKFVRNAGQATGDYVAGAESTTKDQAAAAIAAEGNYQAGVTAAITRKAFSKGLQRSGKQGWLDGVRKKGANRFGDGVANSASKYATNSGKYDGARAAANSMPRGPKGSPANIQRVVAVVTAQRGVKTS